MISLSQGGEQATSCDSLVAMQSNIMQLTKMAECADIEASLHEVADQQDEPALQGARLLAIFSHARQTLICP